MVEGLRRVVVTGLGASHRSATPFFPILGRVEHGRNGVGADHTCLMRPPCLPAWRPRSRTLIPAQYRAQRAKRLGSLSASSAWCCQKQAVAQAGLAIKRGAARSGWAVAIASGVGGLLMMETQAHVLADRGPDRVSPFLRAEIRIPNMAGWSGPPSPSRARDRARQPFHRPVPPAPTPFGDAIA